MAELERASKRARGDAGAENAPESAPTAAVSATGGAALGFVAPDAGNASESPPAVAASSSGASEISALGSGSGRASESSPAHAAAGAPAAGNGHVHDIDADHQFQTATLSALERMPDNILVQIIFFSASYCRERGDRVTEPRVLAQLARVSRRFRPLTKEPSLWQQIVLSKLNSSALKGLQQLPGETRDSIRSLTVRICSLSINGFRTLFRAFGSQLQELRVGFHEQTSIPFSSLPLLQHYSSLRSLRLSIAFKRLESNAARISSPVVQDSLALLDALSFERLNLVNFPVSSSTLQTIVSGPSRATVTSLEISLLLAEAEIPVAALGTIGSLTQLTSLTLRTLSTSCALSWFNLSEYAVQPLASLTSLKKLAVNACLSSLEFIRPMTSLVVLSVNVLRHDSACDFTPLLASAHVLQRLQLGLYGKAHDQPVDPDSVVIAPSIQQLTHLKELKLICSESVLRRLSEPLESLKSLRDVTIVRNTMLDPDVIVSDVWFPVALLKHIGSDLPSLKKLCINNFPLRFPDSLRALSSLRRLEKLELLNWAAKSLDAEAREFLRSALPDTKVVFRDDVPPIQ